jgi:hypothetical protein
LRSNAVPDPGRAYKTRGSQSFVFRCDFDGIACMIGGRLGRDKGITIGKAEATIEMIKPSGGRLSRIKSIVDILILSRESEPLR